MDLLRAWQVIPEGSAIGPSVVSEVVKRYADGMWYRFGDTLFDHLARAVKEQNIWIIPGPGNPVIVLEIFLSKTCSVKNPVTMKELRADFQALADEIKRDYGEEIRWRHELHPLDNIQAAKKLKAALWVDHKLKEKHA